MDQTLLSQLVKQLKILNFFLILFGVLILASIVAIGFMLFQVITFAQEASNNFEDFKMQSSEALNLRQQICSDSTIGAFLRSKDGLCK